MKFSISGTELKNIMSDNIMDKTKETANKACNDPRDSCEDVKCAADTPFKTAGVEEQKGKDEVTRTEVPEPSDIKGGIKRPRKDFG
jgi:hypothetical protein